MRERGPQGTQKEGDYEKKTYFLRQVSLYRETFRDHKVGGFVCRRSGRYGICRGIVSGGGGGGERGEEIGMRGTTPTPSLSNITKLC